MNHTQNAHDPSIEPAHHTADVVVVGAGLAGLAAAAYVARAGRSVTVLERKRFPGGLATTDQRAGFSFNQGPHALYRGGPAEEVLAELGVIPRGGKPPVRGKLVFDGIAHTAPADVPTLLRTRALGWREKVEMAKLLASVPRLDAASFAHTSVRDWINRNLSTTRGRAAVESMVRLSTYCHAPDVLSAEVAIGQIQSALGSGVLYLHGGWQQLVDQLLAVPGVDIHTGEVTDALPDAPAVILCVGGPATTGAILGRSFEVGPPAQVSCLDLGLSRPPDADVVIGGDEPFYFSNHSAVADLAPHGHWHAAVAQYLADGDDPNPEALRGFARFAGVSEADIVEQRRLHRMTAVTSIATAGRGGLAGRPRVDATGRPGVFMAGDWIGPEGHLADASLASARASAQAALAWLDAGGRDRRARPRAPEATA